MGNMNSENMTLLDLCKELENLPPNIYINNNKKIDELHKKIFKKIKKYKSEWKIYTDNDLSEYETLIEMTERENIFYKKDISGITEIQYAFNSYLKSKIIIDINLIIEFLTCFPSLHTRTIARFCFDNNISYQKLITYDKQKSIKTFDQTHVYTLYPKLYNVSTINKFNIDLHFFLDKAVLEIRITKNNKIITFVENILQNSNEKGFFFQNNYFEKMEIDEILQMLNE